MGVCRTAAELEEDVKLMLQHTNRVRLYSTECSEVMDGLLKKASHGQISLLLGLWIENSPRDMKELDQLIEHLKKYPNAALEGIVVGNEVLFRGQASPEYMGYLITETRNRVSFPFDEIDVFEMIARYEDWVPHLEVAFCRMWTFSPWKKRQTLASSINATLWESTSILFTIGLTIQPEPHSIALFTGR